MTTVRAETFDQWLERQGVEQGEIDTYKLAVLQAMYRGRFGNTCGASRPQPATEGPRLIMAARDEEHAPIEFLVAPGDVDIQAAEDGDGDKLPTFTMLAYTGAAMYLEWFSPHPVVVNLKGMRIPKRPRPVLRDHDRAQVVGHTTSVEVKQSKLHIAGVVSGTSLAAAEIVQNAKNGFPWQVSIGARKEEVAFIQAGETINVNERTFKGPLYVVQRSTLGELSFVALGADEGSKTKIAASAENVEEKTMDEKLKAWIEAKGFDPEKLTEGQVTFLTAAYEKEQADSTAPPKAGDTPAPGAPLQATGTPAPAPGPGGPVDVQLNVDASAVTGAVDEIRAAAAAESQRIAAIRKLCDGKHTELEAKAIGENWDETRCELEVLRASRPAAPAIHDGDRESGPLVLEAAAMMSGGIRGDDLLETHGEQVVEAADKQYRHGIGLQQLLLEAAWATGCRIRHFREDRRGVLEAAFSTFGLPGILSNIANKFLLAGFMGIEDVWRKIAATRSVKDFKTVTSYRMSGGFEFVEVGPDGELQHGKVTEDSFTNQALTYGQMFSVTRRDLINDDLGALTALPRRIGRGGALKLNTVFWTTFMANSTFFKTANNNYKAGSATALGIDALTTAEQMFLDQTDPDGNPIALAPASLLVPTALKVTAQQLMSSLRLTEGGGSSRSKVPTDNPHAGKFEVECSTYLSRSTITGYSTKAYYLLASPADLPVIEVAFLNGLQEPTVERADADFNTLGILFRGFFDFGAALQEFRGGCKQKGEA